MTEVSISSITITRHRARENGDQPLAIFDFKSAGLHVQGCCLVRRSTGELFIQGPLRKAPSGTSAVSFPDLVLRQAILDRAAAAFHALVGEAAADG